MFRNNRAQKISSTRKWYWRVFRVKLLLAITLIVPVGHAEEGGRSNSFFAYLAGCKPEPALIAFNPSTFDPRTPFVLSDVVRASLRTDLQALAPSFNGLVLYEYHQKLTRVILATAQPLGFRAVLLGIWDPKQDDEIKGVAEMILQFHYTLALAVVIGNEGLIDNRYTIADLQLAAEKLQALLPAGLFVPFTTSEPISEYGLKELREFGDFLAPNIHPAVDQDSVDPLLAAEWVKRRALALRIIGKKPVFVKETGVPNGGMLNYTPQVQQLFWQEYRQGPHFVYTDGAPWISYAAAFEAFNMPWKAEKTGLPIEGRWGLLDTERRRYPAFDVWQSTTGSEKYCLCGKCPRSP
ncbi:Exo-beta-1,3-glucanase [Gammaproteobacteria bacterium]